MLADFFFRAKGGIGTGVVVGLGGAGGAFE